MAGAGGGIEDRSLEGTSGRGRKVAIMAAGAVAATFQRRVLADTLPPRLLPEQSVVLWDVGFEWRCKQITERF
jgi:hypothetical protein